jgi:hypothetical protein
MIWERTGDTPDPQMIKAARTAYRLILELPGAEADDRAQITRTLADALSDLGQGEADSNMLNEALIRFEEAMGYSADWGGRRGHSCGTSKIGHGCGIIAPW